MRAAALVVWALLTAAAGLGPALAEKRVALVIGNGGYKNAPVLVNPRNDANDVGAALKRIGFETIVGLDLDRAGMEETTTQFARAAREADVALFYYAGHAMQYGGVNYLMPVDARLTDEVDLRRMTRVDEIIADLQQARNLRILVLDSCRDNPLAEAFKRSIGSARSAAVGRGLARVDSPSGMILSYATQSGRIAADGQGRNSPYSSAFLRHIETREEVGTIFRRISADVYESTRREQLPELSLSMIGEFFLRGQPQAAELPASTARPPADPAERAWTIVKDTTSVAILEEYLRQHGSSAFAPFARARLEELKRSQLAVTAPPTQPLGPTSSQPRPVINNPVVSQSTIKVGILHSLSGTMAGDERALKDVVLMLIDEQNRKGGLLGRKLEAVVVDPASNWPLFAAKARQLVAQDKVSVVFGCWTSVSRKSVLPVFKELNSILFYPVQYEGEESERNVFYTGAAPNQQAIPAVDYLQKEEKVVRWVLAGTDFVYPRTVSKILESYLRSKGVKPEDIMISYTPFGHADWRTIVADIKKFGSAGKKTAVVSTINGDANLAFFREFTRVFKLTDIPVISLSIGESQLAGVRNAPFNGHLAAWNYFQSIETPANREFVARLRAFTKDPKQVVSDPMEAHAIGFAMWVKAVEKAGTADPDTVISALPGTEVPNLTGGTSVMLPNHHITKPFYVGEVRADGQFDVVWKSPGLIPADAWSTWIEGSKDLTSDWTRLKCGKYNTRTRTCLANN